MNKEYCRDNLRFLAFGTAAIAAMAAFFLFVSAILGGSSFFSDVLRGDLFVPLLAVLIIGGLGTGFYLRPQKQQAA